MRVMLLVTDLERGGSPLRIARLARGLQAAGVDVWAGCLAPPGPVSHDLRAADVRTFACGARGAWDLRALLRLAGHVRRIRPDLIHSTLVHANVAARLVGHWCGVPVIGSTATIEVERRWHRLAELATARADRAHVVNSRAVAEHVVRTCGVPRSRVCVVPPAPEPPRRIARAAARALYGVAPEEFLVAWAGRLDPVKRVGIVVACAEIMQGVPCRFLIAGEGPERGALESRLRRSLAAGRVHLLGWCGEVGPLLCAADVFLFPSLTEGMPNAVLEAMVCGLPIVASDIPVLRELSDNGRRFVLVDGREPGGFAAALLALRADPERRRELGAQAARWADEHLSPRATTEALLAVYRGALATARRGPPGDLRGSVATCTSASG